jgi:uncharacterized protein YggE
MLHKHTHTHHVRFAAASLLIFGMTQHGLAEEPKSSGKDRRIITVQGEGKIQAVPDIATLSVEVNLEADDLDTVTGQVRRQMLKVLDAVKSQGIEEKDIQTQVFDVRPKWEYDRRSNPRRVGYTVTNRVTVKIRDLKKVGRVLAAVTNNGATGVTGPDFQVDNPEAYQRKALSLAYADAHGRAVALVESAGIKLGEILSMTPGSVSWPNPRPLMMRAMAMPAAMPQEEPVSAGEQTLSATVTVVYAIQ